MTATDELRRLLDERGVEWSDYSDKHVLHTSWNDSKCWFNEFPDGLTVWGMSGIGTPEQAIAATLGAGECENVSDEPQHFQCSECRSHGIVRKVFDNRTKFSFCPDCGAKVRKAVKR